MAQCFLCVVGGTGSRVGNAFIQTLLSGVSMPEGSQVHILSVDADLGSVDTKDLIVACDDYAKLHNVIQGNAGFANVNVTMYPWEPRVHDASTLNELVSVNNDANAGAARDLLDILYDQTQQQIPVSDTTNGGFRANPNVGACFLRACLLQDGNKEGTGYNKFKAALRLACMVPGSDVRLLMVGSLFGGTGASSFVCIASDLIAISDGDGDGAAVATIKCGAVMMSPYFTVHDKDNKNIEIVNGFYASTKEALTYYHNNRNTLPFNTFYLFGSPIPRPFEAMDDNQRNPASFVEAEAAQACVDYFVRENAAGLQGKYFYKLKMTEVNPDAAKGDQPSKIDLGLEDFGTGQRAIVPLLKMLRFSINYLLLLNPFLDVLNAADHTPAFFEYGMSKALEENPDMRSDIWRICRRYLHWFSEMADDDTIEQAFVYRQELKDLFLKVPVSIENADDNATYDQLCADYRHNSFKLIHRTTGVHYINPKQLLKHLDRVKEFEPAEKPGKRLARVLFAAMQ